MNKKQTPFSPVDSGKKLPQVEEDILKFWRENKIFEKSVENRKTESGDNVYSFYDGPPFATGLPHYGHIVASVIKDVVPRYWTMKGKYIPRKWGWDCHGLPIENIVEKELGSKTKKEIEELGVEKFNNLCRSKVLSYAEEWKKIITRLGRWADMDNPYKTMDKDFMESVWWTFKQLWDKDLIYYDYRSMHICPRCETTLSQSEVSEGYKDVKDLSVVAKFEVTTNLQINNESTNDADEESNGDVVPLGGVEQSETTEDLPDGEAGVQSQHGDSTDNIKTYILAWTTTPWTLPGNVALAVGKDIDYVVVEGKDENGDGKASFILAENKLEEVFGENNYTIIKKIKGSDLIGLKYKPLWDLYAGDEKLENRDNGWQVVEADFVTTDEGTGVVHIAPAFGEDDMVLGKEKNLPFVQHVAMNGVIDEKVEAVGGLNVKPIENPQATDVEVIKYLANKGLLFHKEKYEHSYPHCWRCDTPLINYATGSWFVAVTKIKKELLENAKDINWTPEHIKEGRWGKWLEGGRDWSISRQRFWASVMPIWKCQGIKSKDKSQKSSDGCGHTVVFGSTAEIEKKLGTFFVMRHGEAEHNVKGILSGQLNDGFNLTDNGVKSVKKAAEKLISKKIDLIISSDIDRAAQTSKIISDTLGVKIIYDERLREVNMGDYDKKKQKDVKSFLQDWSNLKEKIRFPNGDSWDSLKERIENFYNDLFTKYRDKNILIVSHGDTITSLRAVLLSGNYSNALKKVREEPYVKKAEPVEYGYKLINLHKHIVDKITFKCEKCGGEMRRVPDVLDTWFDSGSMPYGQAHYPFDNKEEFEKSFPADFIAEGIDQTRAWFYYLHIIAGGIFNKKAFKNVIVNGIVLAEDGQKMSKKLQNYPDPMEMVNKYGADPLKFYLAQSPVVNAQDLNFSEKDLAEIARGTFRMLWQSYSFFVMYANIDRWSAENQKVETGSQKNILDKWLISELHQLIKEVDEEMENYHLMQATRKFVPFVDNLSNWYIRRSRKRFWKSENDGDKNEAYATLHYVLVELSKTIAPFAPYLTEEIYKNLTGEESVHLQDYPVVNEDLIDEKLNKQMQFVRDIISEGLKLRARTQIKVRQPLGGLKIESGKAEIGEEFMEIIKEELNVKNVEVEDFEFDENAKNMSEINGVKIMLNTEITEDLKLEGQAREIIRAIQQMRKEADYQLDDRIKVNYDGLSEVFVKFGNLIAKETLADNTISGKPGEYDLEKEVSFGDEKIILWIKK